MLWLDKLKNWRFRKPYHQITSTTYYYPSILWSFMVKFKSHKLLLTDLILHLRKKEYFDLMKNDCWDCHFYVFGMSIEMKWRNDEMTNFWIFTQPIFWSTKLSQPRQCRDSCTYYITFRHFVISSFRHFISIDMPKT